MLSVQVSCIFSSLQMSSCWLLTPHISFLWSHEDVQGFFSISTFTLSSSTFFLYLFFQHFLFCLSVLYYPSAVLPLFLFLLRSLACCVFFCSLLPICRLCSCPVPAFLILLSQISHFKLCRMLSGFSFFSMHMVLQPCIIFPPHSSHS